MYIIHKKWSFYHNNSGGFMNLFRNISPIQGEVSVTGPKDSFIENIDTNIGLMKNRITNIKEDYITKGRFTNTKIVVLSIDGITDKRLVNNIKRQISKINIDGIIDSSYLKYNLEKTEQLFPTIILTERPDKCEMALLDGKVVIIVDHSPYALILPSFFIDYFHTIDDYYQKGIHVSFIRIIRLLAFLISILTPALYIAVTTRNYNLIPMDLLLVLKAGRTFVPFPAYLEAIFMIICFEILKESDLRMSVTNGSAVSILGGLILGDAAVAAGIVSPIMIIVIAISSISSFVFSSIEFIQVVRFYKIFLLLLSSLLGIVGVILGVIYLLWNIINTDCFGYPYFYPIIPFSKNTLLDSFIKKDSNDRYRNNLLTNNHYRGRL